MGFSKKEFVSGCKNFVSILKQVRRVDGGNLAWLSDQSMLRFLIIPPSPKHHLGFIKEKVQNCMTVYSSSEHCYKIISHPCKSWEGCLSTCHMKSYPAVGAENKETKLEILKFSIFNHGTTMQFKLHFLLRGVI